MENMKEMNRKELKLDDLGSISGGTGSEYRKYVCYLLNKYKTSGTITLMDKVTDAEYDYAQALCNRKENDPYPTCPDPDYHP